MIILMNAKEIFNRNQHQLMIMKTSIFLFILRKIGREFSLYGKDYVFKNPKTNTREIWKKIRMPAYSIQFIIVTMVLAIAK